MKFRTENKLLTIFSYSSLTDIVMLLLIFFLLTSTFILQPGLKVQLPSSESKETETKQPITITLTKEGALFLNDNPILLTELGPGLVNALAASQEQVVVVSADKNVPLQAAVEVMDIARASGASRLIIATSPPVIQ